MRFPLSLTTDMAGYMLKKKLRRERRFPLVMMLEPLHACNLTCTGCGRIREYESTIKQKLTVEECLAAVDECGAPTVSICGGEPMIYPEIGRLVREIVGRRKTHDKAVEREGVFDAAVEGIRAAKAAGFMVTTNTTVYRETNIDEI